MGQGAEGRAGHPQLRQYWHSGHWNGDLVLQLCPDVPLGYLKFSELALSLNQTKHAGAILRKGMEVCSKVGAKAHSARMAYMLAVCRVMGCGGEGDAQDTTWTMKEINDLQVRGRVQSRSATMRWGWNSGIPACSCLAGQPEPFLC